MDDLIEKLFEEHARLLMNDKCEMLFTDFAQAIQTACKAQRNACKRVYNEVCLYSSISTTTTVSLIKNAEIEREDYENISN